MAHTYEAGSGSDRDRIRSAIRDVTRESGPLPSGANFSDAELTDFVSVEGSWQKATALAFETLAAAWRRYADMQVGERRESYSQVSDGYAADAERWRERYGSAGGSTVGSVFATRVDGYSDDISAGSV